MKLKNKILSLLFIFCFPVANASTLETKQLSQKKNDKVAIQKKEFNLDDYSDINKAFSLEVKRLLVYYSRKKIPLTAEILDSSNDKVKNFLIKDLNYSAEHPLATHYFPNFKVDNKETAFCLIYYDSKQNLFKSYESMKNLSKYESMQYLTWHEMGHCLGRYEGISLEDRKNEEFSDEFAVAVAQNNNNDNLAKKIVKQVSFINEDSMHGNGKQVAKFYDELIAKKIFITPKTLNQVLEVVIYFNQNGTLDKFRFKTPIMRTELINLNYVTPPKGTVQRVNKNYSK